jgi:hypothetical protein
VVRRSRWRFSQGTGLERAAAARPSLEVRPPRGRLPDISEDTVTTPEPPGRTLRRSAVRASPAVYFTDYGLSLLGKGIASVVMPLLVLDRTGDVLAAVLATVATATSAAAGVEAEASAAPGRRPRPRRPPGAGPFA